MLRDLQETGYKIEALGDRGLLITLADQISIIINEQVYVIYDAIRRAQLNFITDLLPAYSSMGIFYDPHKVERTDAEATIFENVKLQIEKVISSVSSKDKRTYRTFKIPVCYNIKCGLDIFSLSHAKKTSLEELIALHTAVSYTVFLIGFLPGFPYMGKVPEKLTTFRKAEPRTLVPAGSVGIAGEQTGIYPFDSPGGWNIIGATPVKIFDVKATPPCLFQGGDQVTFYPITEDEYYSY